MVPATLEFMEWQLLAWYLAGITLINANVDQAPFGQGHPLASATPGLASPSDTMTLIEDRRAWAQRKLPV